MDPFDLVKLFAAVISIVMNLIKFVGDERVQRELNKIKLTLISLLKRIVR